MHMKERIPNPMVIIEMHIKTTLQNDKNLNFAIKYW